MNFVQWLLSGSAKIINPNELNNIWYNLFKGLLFRIYAKLGQIYTLFKIFSKKGSHFNISTLPNHDNYNWKNIITFAT